MDLSINNHLLQILDKLSVRTIPTSDGTFIYAKDLADTLGLKNTRTSTVNFTSNDIVSPELRAKHNIITFKEHRDNIVQDNKIILLTECGAKRLIAQSRSPIAEQLRAELKCEFNRSVPEADFINKIRAIFSTETFETQYPVLNYRIDLYMPKYNLAIEFDENHHQYRAPDDRTRENEITAAIGCRCLRHAIGSDIYEFAGIIYKIIHSQSLTSIGNN